MISILSCTAVLLLMASTVMAAALGPHDDGSGNPCRKCHNTASGTAALRGFAGSGAPPSVGWGAKSISALCAYCHDSAGGGAINATDQTANAYDTDSHGFEIGNLPEAPAGEDQTTDLTGSGLPYTSSASGEIECTSCHNVHVVTVRPFNQRGSIEALCNQCHGGRVNATPTRTSTSLGERDYSTHPTSVGLGDAGDADARANLKEVADMAAVLKTAVADSWSTSDAWALGGHFIGASTSEVSCQTCHAVHGPSQDNTAGLGNLLAIENDNAVDGTNPAALCEGCHYGGEAGEQVGSLIEQADLLAGSYSDHPIDSLGNGAFYPTGVAVPTQWQSATLNFDTGATAMYGAAATAKPTCQSCHDTHGGIAGQPLLRAPQTPSETTIANFNDFSYDIWCFACHTNEQVIPDNHHSVINNMDATNLGDAISSQLSCGDCHGNADATDWTAHNGFWTWTIAISDTDSAFCEGCHTRNNPRIFEAGGLKGNQTFTDGGSGSGFPATHGSFGDGGADDTTGDASHQVAEAVDQSNTNLEDSPDWSFAGTEAGRVSQWSGSGTSLTVLCESCHNILWNGLEAAKGLKQGWRANLLLAPYEDNNSGVSAGGTLEGSDDVDWYSSSSYEDEGAAGQTNSDFCRACHRSTTSTFVHNPEAHTLTPFAYSDAVGSVSRLPYGRSETALLTTPNDPSSGCPDVSTADAASAPGRASYPDENAVDCDSCHRPHNADVDSLDSSDNRHLILETTDTNWGTTICAECHNTDIQCQ